MTAADTSGGDSGASVSTPAQADPIGNSVVKIVSTVRYPDYYKPWTKQAPSDISGSGVVIGHKRILTNAHLVLYASQIQVQANQSGTLISATVETVAPDMDLAVLKLDDETFFDSHPALELSPTTPQTESPVTVYGYPLGGSGLSITKGIISRVEYAAYGTVGGLRIQIDAAINSGNSGGPAVVGSKMIGLTYSRLVGTAQNIGYIIPSEEIRLFVQSIADGQYKGKLVMPVEIQALSNPTLRSYLQLDNSVHGVVVIRPDSSDPNYPLKKWDVITKAGGIPLDDEGMIILDNGLRLFFKYLLQTKVKDNKISLSVLRSGKEMEVDLPVAGNTTRLMPDLKGAYPSYFVYGPMVFSTATTEFVNGLTGGRDGGLRMGVLGYTGNPLVSRMGEKPGFNGETLVVVSSPFFPHRLSKGYGNPSMQVIKTVNDIPIKNLEHLVQVLRDAQGKYVTIEFAGQLPQVVVFPRADMAAATDQILLDNDIRSQGTPDVMSVWNAKSAGSN